jgi:hypothetical protein
MYGQLSLLPFQQQQVLKKLLQPSIPNIDGLVNQAGKLEWNRTSQEREKARNNSYHHQNQQSVQPPQQSQQQTQQSLGLESGLGVQQDLFQAPSSSQDRSLHPSITDMQRPNLPNPNHSNPNHSNPGSPPTTNSSSHEPPAAVAPSSSEPSHKTPQNPGVFSRNSRPISSISANINPNTNSNGVSPYTINTPHTPKGGQSVHDTRRDSPGASTFRGDGPGVYSATEKEIEMKAGDSGQFNPSLQP